MNPPRARAVFFVDGNNWYHSLRELGLPDIGRLNYARIFDKLAGPARDWVEARYYIPDVGVMGDPELLRSQREFLQQLLAQDSRIRVRQGRLEERTSRNRAATELLQYLAELKVKIDTTVYADLVALGRAHREVRVFVEKAVDVQIAVDMVQLAASGGLDVAYLLSADGDYTPAAEAVRGHGRKIFSATPAPCAKLAAAVDRHIPLRREWFADCYRGGPPTEWMASGSRHR